MTVVTIGIAGGTGSGKTTLARRLHQAIGPEYVNYLIHDSYYKDLSHQSMEERMVNNFDHPSSLDTNLLVAHLRCLKQNQSCEVPTYDFCTHCRANESIVMEPRQVILVEGILLFCHAELCDELDIKVFVDADSDIRLLRRMTRDIVERGRTMDQVLAQYQTTVRPMHNQFVEPSKAKADMIVHSHGHSLDVATAMLTNHAKLMAGLIGAASGVDNNNK